MVKFLSTVCGCQAGGAPPDLAAAEAPTGSVGGREA
jgi:hypothetical protein